MIKSMDYNMELYGSDETKEKALNRIFAQIKSQIARDFPEKSILKIEPKEFSIVKAMENHYTERFFGLFFPRRRVRFDIKASVTVHLRYIETGEICCEVLREEMSPIQRILIMR